MTTRRPGRHAPDSGLCLASLADVPRITAITAAASDEPWSPDLIAQLIGQPGGWAVLTAPAIVGLGGFVLGRSIGGEAEIVNLAVAPEDRRRGLGGALLNAAILRAAEDLATALFLEVAVDNVAARALYDAAGFKIVGRRPDYYTRVGNIRIDAIIMRRDLVSPEA